jgi:ribosome biogenesis GTPase / thiamine phosphate phosphatase
MKLDLQVRARVSFAAQERYRIIVEGRECDAVPAGALRWDGSLPAVGDWVKARWPDASLAVIEEVLPRANAISRKQPGRGHDEQVLAANVDLVILVAALDHDFNPRRLERYLVLAAECGARALVALNKAELCEDVAARVAEVQAIAPGVACVTLSAIDSVEPLRAWIGTGTVVLLGSSGAGKSTIVNGLLGGERQRQATQPVREHDSRGRHTTTHRMLFALPGGGALIDTPGLRELGLWAGQPALDEVFSEIVELASRCRFADCSHAGEPGCAVSAARTEGVIEADRWASYQKLQAEVRYLERSTDKAAGAAEKQKWKVIHKAMRHHPKYRR